MRSNLLKIFPLFLLYAMSDQPLKAQGTGTWVACHGEIAVQNISLAEAHILAKRQARLDAIEKACGVSMQAETLVKDFMLAGDFVHSVSCGSVIEERNYKWDSELLPPENPSSPPIVLLKLSMEAKVLPVTEKPDPSFQVVLDVDRTVFQSGDEVILSVKATKDCYLTVLCIAANDSVYILLPNSYEAKGFLRADVPVKIPEKRSRDAGIHFRVANLPGHKQDTEIIKVIATKQKMTLLDVMANGGVYGLLGTPKVAVTKLARWLAEIPLSERAEANMVYTIIAKESKGES